MLGVLLAGGRNTRMPFLKGFIEIEGVTILKRNLRILKETFGRAVISANKPELYFNLGAPVVGDVFKDTGPMGGIYSALLTTKSPWVFVAACDMPFINPRLVDYIAGKRGGSATVPVFDGRVEPLLGAYSSNAMRYMEGAFADGKTSLMAMLDGMDTLYIDESDVRRLDPDGRSFVNINSIEDYKGLRSETKTLNLQQGGAGCLV